MYKHQNLWNSIRRSTALLSLAFLLAFVLAPAVSADPSVADGVCLDPADQGIDPDCDPVAPDGGDDEEDIDEWENDILKWVQPGEVIAVLDELVAALLKSFAPGR